LTYKERKTDKSVIDRVEINIPLDKNKLNEHSVNVFLKFLGCKKEFALRKNSYIYTILDGKCIVVLALYDVWLDKNDIVKTFVEVEIDSKSKCNKTEALKVLKKWGKFIESEFPITTKKPMNNSLYEIYKRPTNDK
jgi:adenylate cyclase class IV